MENETEGECSRTIPERMFAVGEEPVGVRVTPYHKPFAISNILWALQEDEVEALRQSPFVVRMLKKRSVTAKETRIKYAFLALLASVQYPREEQSLYISNTTALKGFVLALQLVMIEAVPALTEAVHDGGSSGSEGDFADDDELSDEESKGKRSISPGHACDTDCAGKAGVVSITAAGSEESNGDSQFGWSDDEEDDGVENLVKLIKDGFPFNHSFFKGGASKSDVVRMREETRSEAEIRKTSKQKSSQSSGDVVDAESIAASVKGLLSGDLTRLSEELSRVGADLLRMATELKTFGAAFSTLQSSIVSNVEDMLKTYLAELVKNVTNPVILSPGPSMQHATPTVAVTSCNISNLGAYKSAHSEPERMETDMGDGMVEPLAGADVRTSREDLSKYSSAGLNDVETQPTERSHQGVDVGKIIESALVFADNVEFEGVNQTMRTDTTDNVYVCQPSPKGSAGEEESCLDEGFLFPKPSFSLGLSQEVPQNLTKVCDVVNEESCDISFNNDDGVSVQEDAALCLPFRKSKRQKAHVAGNRTGDDIDAEANFSKLREILKTPFSFNVHGVKIESNDLSVLVEKSAHVPMKLSKSYGRFSKVKKGESFKFPPTLLESVIGGCISIDSVTRFYFPFNLDKTHWVGVCIDATSWHLQVLDCNVSIRSDVMMSKEMAPIALMFPFLLRQAGKQISMKELKALAIERPRTVLKLQNQFASTVTAVLLIQAHAFGGLEMTKCISPGIVDSEVERVAVTIVETYHGKI
ncbi:hypothetical protein Bca101_026764 [Brassica carinata]